MPAAAFLLLTGALQTEPAPLHTPIERAITHSRIFVDCIIDQARIAGTGRAALRVALAVARRRCQSEERALDDAYRAWQRALDVRARGVSRAEIERLVNEAIARVEAERRGGVPR